MHAHGAAPEPVKKSPPAAVKQFMNHSSIPYPTRQSRRSAERLAWLLLTGWLVASGAALAEHMLENPADICTTPRTPTATDKVLP